jgi:hypothetical protein
MGSVLAFRALGVRARLLDSGAPVLDASKVDLEARKSLLAAVSKEVVLAAVWTVIGIPGADHSFCEALVSHAKLVYSATEASCDHGPRLAIGQSPGEMGTAPAVTQKVTPPVRDHLPAGFTLGRVDLVGVIDEAGNVSQGELERGVLVLYRDARNSIMKCKFPPAIENGVPVAKTVSASVTFGRTGG